MRLSHVGDASDDQRSLGGSGHAVAFDRPEKAGAIVAIQIYASRYGLPEPPQEDFHVRLLDKDRKVLKDFPFPYAKIARGPMQWYTLGVPATEVPEHFYVALAFNPEQTKGIYLGLDKNVKESHSYIGLPEDGFQPVPEKYDWMVRAYSHGFAQRHSPPTASSPRRSGSFASGMRGPSDCRTRRSGSARRREKAAAEDKFIEQLSSDEEKERVEAIDALVGLGSKKAVPAILQIAADRKEKNNWDRHTACRALGMLGDSSVVPELVHLTYHYNWNTRQWARDLPRAAHRAKLRPRRGRLEAVVGKARRQAADLRRNGCLGNQPAAAVGVERRGRSKQAGGARPPGHGDDNQGSQAADRHPHAVQRRQGRGPGLARDPRHFRYAHGKRLLLDGRRAPVSQVARGQTALLVGRPQDLRAAGGIGAGPTVPPRTEQPVLQEFPQRGGHSLGARGILVQNATTSDPPFHA